MERGEDEFKVVCLQRYPEYYEQTITLLNNQWPRSRTARLRSLEQGSPDSLPTSLVMLQKQDNGTEEAVVAHSKISPVPYQPRLCFVESVVVEPSLRGKGIGRLIMQKTEEYVKAMGITIVYLTTVDQQGFYSRLGYELCDPIVVFGGSIKLAEKADSNVGIFSFSHQSPENITDKSKPTYSSNTNHHQVKSQELDRIENLTVRAPLPPPPPPLPPPPVPANNPACNNNQILAKVTMRKIFINVHL